MKQIGTLGTIDTLTVGGRVLTDLNGLITLNAVLSGTNVHYSTARLWNGTSGYQVTAGKTLTIVGSIWSITEAATTNAGGVLLYADNDIGIDNATVPTNPVYGFSDTDLIVNFPATSVGIFGISVNFQVPSGKYPAILTQQAVTGHIQLYGYEV